jgi:hypothetical protein
MENLHLKNLQTNTIHPMFIQKVMFKILNNDKYYKQKIKTIINIIFPESKDNTIKEYLNQELHEVLKRTDNYNKYVLSSLLHSINLSNLYNPEKSHTLYLMNYIQLLNLEHDTLNLFFDNKQKKLLYKVAFELALEDKKHYSISDSHNFNLPPFTWIYFQVTEPQKIIDKLNKYKFKKLELTKEEYDKRIEQLKLYLKTIIVYEHDAKGRKRKSSTHKAFVYKLFTEKYEPLIKIKEKENDNL